MQPLFSYRRHKWGLRHRYTRCFLLHVYFENLITRWFNLNLLGENSWKIFCLSFFCSCIFPSLLFFSSQTRIEYLFSFWGGRKNRQKYVFKAFCRFVYPFSFGAFFVAFPIFFHKLYILKLAILLGKRWIFTKSVTITRSHEKQNFPTKHRTLPSFVKFNDVSIVHRE